MRRNLRPEDLGDLLEQTARRSPEPPRPPVPTPGRAS